MVTEKNSIDIFMGVLVNITIQKVNLERFPDDKVLSLILEYTQEVESAKINKFFRVYERDIENKLNVKSFNELLSFGSIGDQLIVTVTKGTEFITKLAFVEKSAAKPIFTARPRFRSLSAQNLPVEK